MHILKCSVTGCSVTASTQQTFQSSHFITLLVGVCSKCGLFLVCGCLTVSFKLQQTVHLLKCAPAHFSPYAAPPAPFLLLQTNQTRFHLFSFITPKMRQQYPPPGMSLGCLLCQNTQSLLVIFPLLSVEIAVLHSLIDCKVYLIFTFAFKVIFCSPSSF